LYHLPSNGIWDRHHGARHHLRLDPRLRELSTSVYDIHSLFAKPRDVRWTLKMFGISPFRFQKCLASAVIVWLPLGVACSGWLARFFDTAEPCSQGPVFCTENKQSQIHSNKNRKPTMVNTIFRLFPTNLWSYICTIMWIKQSIV